MRIAQSQRFEDPNVVLDIGYYTADLIVARTTAMWRLEKGPPTRCWIE